MTIEIWDIISIWDTELLQNNVVWFAKCFDVKETALFKKIMIKNKLLQEDDFPEEFDSIILMSPKS